MQPAFPTFSRNRGAPVFEEQSKNTLTLQYIKHEEQHFHEDVMLSQEGSAPPGAGGVHYPEGKSLNALG